MGCHGVLLSCNDFFGFSVLWVLGDHHNEPNDQPLFTSLLDLCPKRCMLRSLLPNPRPSGARREGFHLDDIESKTRVVDEVSIQNQLSLAIFEGLLCFQNKDKHLLEPSSWQSGFQRNEN